MMMATTNYTSATYLKSFMPSKIRQIDITIYILEMTNDFAQAKTQIELLDARDRHKLRRGKWQIDIHDTIVDRTD
jgi:hypothetical protein